MGALDMERRRLPDSELEVMMAVWQGEGPTHTGEILQRLDPAKKRKLQSVQMLLSRLVEKGYLSCEKLGRLNYYTALVKQESYRAQETSSFIDKLYGSSPARLVAALVQEQQISREELAEIRRMLEEEGGEV